MRALVRRLALLVLPLALIAAVSGCGGGGSAETNAVGDREGSTTAAPSADPSREEGLMSALRGGGYVIHFRHTATNWASDDEHPVVLSDCETQRNLSTEGRRQAHAIGEAIERLEIPIGRVLSSPFCRALDTARLAFGRAQIEATLENLETAETEAERELRTTASGACLPHHPVEGRTPSCPGTAGTSRRSRT
jgi:Histidine phosphatase superfamily (branch 1)